jgi:hypothetical protein
MAEARAPDLRDMYSRQGLQIKNGGITLSANGYIKGGKTAYAAGTGFFLGYSGGAYKFDIGSSTSYLRWTGTALSLIGDITGASNIEITGRVVIQGTGYTVNSLNAALHVNYGGAAPYGSIFYSSTTGASAVHAIATGGATAVAASATGGGSAVRGVATTSGSGVTATGLSGATALTISGPTTTDGQITSTLADGTAPFVVTSTTLVNNLNAQYLNGSAAGAYSTIGHNHNLVYLGITDKAADSSLLDGHDSAVFFRNDGTTTAGDPGAPTHTVNAVINGVTVRVHVSYP